MGTGPVAHAQPPPRPAFYTMKLAGGMTGILTNHVLIVYQPSRTSAVYAQQAARALTHAWDTFHRGGYRHPPFADRYLLVAYIVDRIDPEGLALGSYQMFGIGRAQPHLLIRNGLEPARLQTTCVHEFFHFIQQAYDPYLSPGLAWLWEATATWTQDEVIPGAPFEASFLAYLWKWYELWSDGVSLDHYAPLDPSLQYMPYGSSIFFKYLSEHHPNRRAVIRRIWETIGRGERDGLRAILSVFPGGASGQLRAFEDLYVDFNVAVELKTERPWDFRRGREIVAWLLAQGPVDGWVHEQYVPASGVVQPAWYTLGPLSATYVDFRAPRALLWANETEKLRLILRPPAGGILRTAKAILFTGVGLTLHEVKEIPVGRVTTIEPYSPAARDINRVLLVVPNPYPVLQSLEVAAVVGDPPYLRALTVERASPRTGRQTIYDASWSEDQASRTLTVHQNGVELEEDEAALTNVSLNATFSRSVVGPPTVTIGGVEATWRPAPGPQRTWLGEIAQVPIGAGEGTTTLEIAMSAQGPDGLALDAAPATAATLDANQLWWSHYETAPGGPDEHRGGTDSNHRISVQRKEQEEKPSPEPAPPKPVPAPAPGPTRPSGRPGEVLDLNGLWTMGEGDTFRIEHVGSSVRATWVKVSDWMRDDYGFRDGDHHFSATLQKDGTLNGQMNVHLALHMKDLCPGAWERLVPLEATATSSTISGQWWWIRIDEECRETAEGWDPYSATRIEDEPGGSSTGVSPR